jgi:hypothetical protein
LLQRPDLLNDAWFMFAMKPFQQPDRSEHVFQGAVERGGKLVLTINSVGQSCARWSPKDHSTPFVFCKR